MNAARAGANLASLANALLGVGAILYILAGNKPFSLALLVLAIGSDGLDGMLSRRARDGAPLSGRIADSVADAVSFGVAPAALVVVHTVDTTAWSAVAWASWAVGAELGVLAVARLVYFTAVAHGRPHFVGAPTPQTAIAVALVVLVFDQPGFLGSNPPVVLGLVALLGVLMVLPIPYPKARPGAPLRWTLAPTAAALAMALLPIQYSFHVASGSPWYVLAEAATFVALAFVALAYVAGPILLRTGSRSAVATAGVHGPE